MVLIQDVYSPNLHPYDYLLTISVQTNVWTFLCKYQNLKSLDHVWPVDKQKRQIVHQILAGKNKLLPECFDINISKIIYINQWNNLMTVNIKLCSLLTNICITNDFLTNQFAVKTHRITYNMWRTNLR